MAYNACEFCLAYGSQQLLRIYGHNHLGSTAILIKRRGKTFSWKIVHYRRVQCNMKCWQNQCFCPKKRHSVGRLQSAEGGQWGLKRWERLLMFQDKPLFVILRSLWVLLGLVTYLTFLISSPSPLSDLTEVTALILTPWFLHRSVPSKHHFRVLGKRRQSAWIDFI